MTDSWREVSVKRGRRALNGVAAGWPDGGPGSVTDGFWVKTDDLHSAFVRRQVFEIAAMTDD